MTSAALARHHWVWLDPGADWCLGTASTADDAAAVAAWLRAERPFVVRSRRPADPVGWQPLGLALAQPKRRIAVSARADHIIRIEPPPLLRDIAPGLAPAWTATALGLDAVLAAAGMTPAVFGSAAWQHRCDVRWMTPGSDLDLLLPVDSQRQLWACTAALLAWQATAPARLDGECVWPCGRAVHWKELAARPAQVLIKTAQGAALDDLHAMLALLQ